MEKENLTFEISNLESASESPQLLMRSHEAGPDITFIVTYACAHCHAMLEARTGSSSGWLRCPNCGRASRPPDYSGAPPHVPPPLGDDVLVIGPEPDLRPMTPVGQAPVPPYPRHAARMLLQLHEQAVVPARVPPYPRPRRSHYPGGRRFAYAAALAISVALLLISALEGSYFASALIALYALVFLSRLAGPWKRG
jgi:hypothetical protein